MFRTCRALCCPAGTDYTIRYDTIRAPHLYLDSCMFAFLYLSATSRNAGFSRRQKSREPLWFSPAGRPSILTCVQLGGPLLASSAKVVGGGWSYVQWVPFSCPGPRLHGHFVPQLSTLEVWFRAVTTWFLQLASQV